jgi:hypothetical protein
MVNSCSFLTTLSLCAYDRQTSHFDLSLISRYCPRIADLTLMDFAVYQGSLEECAFIESLSFSFSPDAPLGLHSLSKALPSRSSATLTSLSVYHTPRLTSDSWKSLDEFVNLSTLRINAARHSDFYKAVAESHIAVRNVELDMPADQLDLEPFFSMLRSPALQYLESLDITERAGYHAFLYPDSFYWKRQRRVLECLMGGLHHLRNLTVDMRINTHWVSQMTGLGSLENLTWTVMRAIPRQESFVPMVGSYPTSEDFWNPVGMNQAMKRYTVPQMTWNSCFEKPLEG